MSANLPLVGKTSQRKLYKLSNNFVPWASYVHDDIQLPCKCMLDAEYCAILIDLDRAHLNVQL